MIAGGLTDQCVESAVRDACDLGYLVREPYCVQPGEKGVGTTSGSLLDAPGDHADCGLVGIASTNDYAVIEMC